MIAAFLGHHISRARRGYITNALANCHAKGMFSVVLHDEPGNRIRMFVATESHELVTAEGRPALAVHAHHSGIRLVRIYGGVTNHLFVKKVARGEAYAECEYSSGVTGTPGLTVTGKTVELQEWRTDHNWADLALSAPDLHTVSVPQGASAAWLVIEGQPDPGYRPVCYSRDPAAFRPAGLYQPIDSQLAAFVIEQSLCRFWAEKAL